MSKNSENKVIISFESFITVGYDVKDTHKLIKPVEENRTVDINIKYGINSSDRLLHKLILRSYIGRTTPIKVEIIEKPEFCSAYISKNPTLKITQDIISGNIYNYSLTLTVSVNENAPGFIDFVIAIKASVPEFMGRFGFTKIIGANSMAIIRLQPSYFPKINLEQPDGNEFNVSPYHETKIPLIIHNLGNAPTEFFLENIDHPKEWEVSIDKIFCLPVGGNQTTYLTVKTDHKFDKYNLQLKINSSYLRDPNYSGKGYILNFSVINDGSYMGDIINAIIIIVVVIIVIIILFIVFWFYKFKRK